eukprot:TRINITY_DN5543_c0_g1_i3.p1 TRINITY_DN5543_c0_g1~~TRINITY_DN5543_c0_g1_i3.p1  ORF type:complete len:210 (-),score=23.18 TRINITY_DN5543_c0_g1_i3:45-674(-)
MELETDETGWRIVPVLACVLRQLCRRNDRRTESPRLFTKFHALHPPAVSVHDYLIRMARYAGCSGECFVLALVYIDRIIKSNYSFAVNSLNVHRLLIISVMLAAKFFDDQYYNNAYYAQIGGVSTEEINTLEVEFLFMINFSLHVTRELYDQYHRELTKHMSSGCSCQQNLPNNNTNTTTTRTSELQQDSSTVPDSSSNNDRRVRPRTK